MNFDVMVFIDILQRCGKGWTLLGTYEWRHIWLNYINRGQDPQCWMLSTSRLLDVKCH